MSIGFKELLLILALVGGLIWMRSARVKMDQETEKFFHKLKGPESGGQGFGWRGLLVAFVLGLVCCCVFALVVLRIWAYYHPTAAW